MLGCYVRDRKKYEVRVSVVGLMMCIRDSKVSLCVSVRVVSVCDVGNGRRCWGGCQGL